MGLRRFTERQHAIDDGHEPPGRDVLEHGEQVGLAAHRRAEHVDLAKEDLAQIDRRVEPGGRTARTLFANTSPPTCSITTSTPRLFVSARVSATKSCVV